MEVMQDYLYTKEHEWIRIDGNQGTVGITEYAQASLGDITFAELPQVESEVEQFGQYASLESVKAASDVFAPMSGRIIDVNIEVEHHPELLNKSCYENGWIAKIELSDLEEKSNLMNAVEYQKFLESLEAAGSASDDDAEDQKEP